MSAVLAADIVGYSRLMGADEEGTLSRFRALRRDVIDPEIAARQGRIFQTTNDGLLVEFASPVEAIRCAVNWQRATAVRNQAEPPERRIAFRIGVNQTSDIHRDDVNVATRLARIADAGGIAISEFAHESVKDNLTLAFDDLGPQTLEAVAVPVRAYRVRIDDLPVKAWAPSAPAIRFFAVHAAIAVTVLVVTAALAVGSLWWQQSNRAAPVRAHPFVSRIKLGERRRRKCR